MNKTLFCVEGEHDRSRILKLYPDVLCLITNGSALSFDICNVLKKYEELGYKIILFLDPDSPGNKIRRALESNLNNFYNCYLEKNKCISKNKKKVGIEHASDLDIINALDKVVHISKDQDQVFDFNFLFQTGLVGTSNSKNLRSFLLYKLNLPFCNAKILLKYLNTISVCKEKVLEILNEYRS